MASRSDSRTVMVTISVPSGNSSITGAGALLVMTAGAAGAFGLSSPDFSVAAGAEAWPSACIVGVGADCAGFEACGFEPPPAAAAATSSPSPAMMAIGVFTFTPSVPSSMRILARTPSSMASTSIVALSVSISARTSPDLTASPSFFSHLASLPSSIVGDSAGIRMSVAMRFFIRRLAGGLLERK